MAKRERNEKRKVQSSIDSFFVRTTPVAMDVDTPRIHRSETVTTNDASSKRRASEPLIGSKLPDMPSTRRASDSAIPSSTSNTERLRDTYQAPPGKEKEMKDLWTEKWNNFPKSEKGTQSRLCGGGVKPVSRSLSGYLVYMWSDYCRHRSEECKNRNKEHERQKYANDPVRHQQISDKDKRNRNKEVEEGPYYCPMANCDHKYMVKVDLDRHIATKHGTDNLTKRQSSNSNPGQVSRINKLPRWKKEMQDELAKYKEKFLDNMEYYSKNSTPPSIWTTYIVLLIPSEVLPKSLNAKELKKWLQDHQEFYSRIYYYVGKRNGKGAADYHTDPKKKDSTIREYVMNGYRAFVVSQIYFESDDREENRRDSEALETVLQVIGCLRDNHFKPIPGKAEFKICNKVVSMSPWRDVLTREEKGRVFDLASSQVPLLNINKSKSLKDEDEKFNLHFEIHRKDIYEMDFSKVCKEES